MRVIKKMLRCIIPSSLCVLHRLNGLTIDKTQLEEEEEKEIERCW